MPMSSSTPERRSRRCFKEIEAGRGQRPPRARPHRRSRRCFKEIEAELLFILLYRNPLDAVAAVSKRLRRERPVLSDSFFRRTQSPLFQRD